MRPGLTHNPCRSRERILGGSEAQRNPASDLCGFWAGPASGVRSPLPAAPRRSLPQAQRPGRPRARPARPAPPGGEKREGRSAQAAPLCTRGGVECECLCKYTRRMSFELIRSDQRNVSRSLLKRVAACRRTILISAPARACLRRGLGLSQDLSPRHTRAPRQASHLRRPGGRGRRRRRR